MPDAREIECAVLGNDDPVASVAGEIFPGREFYDYEAEVPRRRVAHRHPGGPHRRAARRGAAALDRGVPGHRRVRDVASGLPALPDRPARLVLNEINTIPGFTTISMFAKLWEASGLTYPALVDRLIGLAIERHQEKQRLRTSAL